MNFEGIQLLCLYMAGAASDLALCMTQNSVEPPDVQLQCAQWACLCLNYTSLKYSNK